MPETPKLILDTFSEVYPMLRSYAHDEFWDLSQHQTVPGAVYVIGRKQYIDNRERVISMAQSGQVTVVMSNPHEGSETLIGQLTHLGLQDLALQQKILIVGGGDMPPEWPCLRFDKFLAEILDYEENVAASANWEQIYQTTDKPYKFLFLNGRRRNHRKYMLEKIFSLGLLDSALWTNLDAQPGYGNRYQLWHNGVNLMQQPRSPRTLPSQYEFPRYSQNSDPESSHSYIKFDLFNNEWGEIYLHLKPYSDTYFSLVTETVFDIPYSFRTEKIWKPIVMGHPWIAVANRGFYRDMHNLGFRTFGHIIDESFDQIDNNQDRLDRIAGIVQDLCQQDLLAFLAECYSVCKYNQQHHKEVSTQVREEFPTRFFQFINERS